ncbi:MAG: hypothetical protein P1S59_14120 [bacterium]|nr:hypothetical protein [bacterium]
MSLLKSLLPKIGRFYLKHPIKLTILGLYILAVVLTGTVIGRVTDADTGEPIEGAVVMASWEWVLPVPPEGEPVNALAETVSGKRGWFFICRPTLLIFSYPMVTVYSNDHLMWNNDAFFDGKTHYWSSDKDKKHPHRFWMRVSLTPWVEGMSHCEQEDYFFDIFTVGGGSTKFMGKALDREQHLCTLELRRNRELQGEQQ